MSTTTAAIRTAIKTVITGLTPAGTAFGRSAYVEASQFEEWDTRAGADIDREFTIDWMPPGNVTTFGIVTESELVTSLTVKIGHWKTADLDASRSRLEVDLYQIVRHIEKNANKPSGVRIIRLDGDPLPRSFDDHWVTDLTFRVLYDGALSP